MVESIAGSEMCFACGRLNPIGLKLDFHKEGDVVWTFFSPNEEHQGWHDYTHGGILCTVMDEVMAQWVFLNGYKAMTAELTVRFIKPVVLKNKIYAESKLIKHKGSFFELSASALLEDKSVAVRATGKFIAI